MPLCVTTGLSPYQPSAQNPWNVQRLKHVFNRLGFSLNHTEYNALLQVSPSDLIDQLVDAAVNKPLPTPPPWKDFTEDDYNDFDEVFEQQIEWTLQWVQDMQNGDLREKMALFWHNHFVTQIRAYECPSYLYRYHTLLQTRALGNFKTFVEEMGINEAMLVYLNGNTNNKFSPNENYARELYELFTLGQDVGYTQTDIEQTAAALTGYQAFGCRPTEYNAGLFSEDEKTIFGQTGNWGYADVHRILFEERSPEIATHICRKLYQFFVYNEPDEAIVADLAVIMQQNNFEIEPVLLALFKSEHFFDDAVIGIQIKSPAELILGFHKQLGLSLEGRENEIPYYLMAQLGQELFNPIDVAGWQGHHNWISNSSLTTRWQFIEFLIFDQAEENTEYLLDFGRELTNNSNDPKVITQIFVDYFTVKGFQNQAAYDTAETVFKAEIPQNYFDSGQWNFDFEYAHFQIALLVAHIARTPEYQLN